MFALLIVGAVFLGGVVMFGAVFANMGVSSGVALFLGLIFTIAVAWEVFKK